MKNINFKDLLTLFIMINNLLFGKIIHVIILLLKLVFLIEIAIFPLIACCFLCFAIKMHNEYIALMFVAIQLCWMCAFMVSFERITNINRKKKK